VAFCGIARPGGFFAMLRERGLRITKQTVFADHHRYTLRDVSRLAESCHREGCSGLVTTEKDAVKLGPELRSQLERAGTLHIARLDAVFVETTAVLQALEAAFG
jgi:tetraacyldisaccharide 4'-kinase